MACARVRVSRRAVVMTLLLAATAVVDAGSAAAEVLVGVARERFVLPRWVPLAGYSRRGGTASTSSHDPVGARALIVQDGETTAVLISCDLLIVDERLFEAVRSRLTAQGLPGPLIVLLAATHTHAGPGAYGTRFVEKLSMGHFDPAVFEGIVQAATQAALRAYVARAPVRIVHVTGTTDGLVRNRVTPDGLVDPELVVVGFYRAEARDPFAVLVNFSAHPTTLGSWNVQLSADYPGVVVREIERRFPGSIGLFAAGAVADQGPVKSGDAFEPAERLGGALARQAAWLLREARPEPPLAVRARQATMALPPAKVRLGRLTLPRWLGRRLVDDDATLSVLAVGTTVFVGVPCDLEASLGMRLKQAAQGTGWNPVLVGFASDYIGYCVSEALYEARGYESSMAFNGPRAGELITEGLLQLLAGLGAGGES